MKTNKPNGAKLPKARRLSTAEALYIYSWGDVWTLRRKRNTTSLPCVVVHNLTRAQAKQLARVHNLSAQHKEQEIQHILLNTGGDSLDVARRLLSFLGHKEEAP